MCALYVTNTAALHHAIWSVVFFFVRLLRLFASQQDYPVYMEAYAKTTRPHCNDQPSHRYLCIVQWVGFFFASFFWICSVFMTKWIFPRNLLRLRKTCDNNIRMHTANHNQFSAFIIIIIAVVVFSLVFSYYFFVTFFQLRATFHFLRRISDLLSLITINVVRLTFFFVFLLCVKRWHI